MNYRILGKTNLKVAEIGMGTWQLANDPGCWVGGNLKESLKSLYAYAERGGNFIDTAWIYGYDDHEPDRHPSEELIGKFLKESGQRDKVIIASKVPPKNHRWPCFKDTPIDEVFPSEWIEGCVNDSLRSLGVETIDLMQFHVWLDDYADLDEWKETVERIIKAGKVRFWGISVNDYQPSNCLKTLETGYISTIQCIFNIFHQKPTEKLFPFAKDRNIGIIARVPLDEGGLSGNITMDRVFPDEDLRSRYFQGDRKEELVERVNTLKKLLGSEAQTMPELALRWILSHDAVSTTIPGMRKLEYVASSTAVSDGRKLSPQLLEELKSHAWERNFYRSRDPQLASTGFVEG